MLILTEMISLTQRLVHIGLEAHCDYTRRSGRIIRFDARARIFFPTVTYRHSTHISMIVFNYCT